MLDGCKISRDQVGGFGRLTEVQKTSLSQRNQAIFRFVCFSDGQFNVVDYPVSPLVKLFFRDEPAVRLF